MTYLAKPKLHHPTLPKNKVGYTRRDYEGKVSTLCAGCGHDSISAALIQAFFELDILPHRVAKLSGIGCSSKRSEEHTSELQSRSDLVCRLLLEKKKKYCKHGTRFTFLCALV